MRIGVRGQQDKHVSDVHVFPAPQDRDTKEGDIDDLRPLKPSQSPSSSPESTISMAYSIMSSSSSSCTSCQNYYNQYSSSNNTNTAPYQPLHHHDHHPVEMPNPKTSIREENSISSNITEGGNSRCGNQNVVPSVTSIGLSPPRVMHILDRDQRTHSSVTVHSDHSSYNEPATAITLNEYLKRVGFGPYQKLLFCLCGLGWMADNMFLQSSGLLLPRLGNHFALDAQALGLISSAMYAGMFVGSVFWGTLSDALGRKGPYQYAFFITLIGALATASVPSSWNALTLLYVGFGIIGFGIGGHISIDTCLFLESIPADSSHWVTLLSLFFSFGSVVTSGLGLLYFSDAWEVQCVASCQGVPSSGWRALLITLAAISLIILSLRWCIPLQETPRFLHTKGKRSELMNSLTNIISFNHRYSITFQRWVSWRGTKRAYQSADFEASTFDEEQTKEEALLSALSSLDTEPNSINSLDMIKEPTLSPTDASHGESPRVKSIFDPRIRGTTILLFFIWSGINLGFTMFNAFIGIFIGSKEIHTTLFDTYLDIFLYMLVSLPASLFATRLVIWKGAKWVTALATLGTGLSLALFTVADTRLQLILSGCCVNICATTMYSALYTYTPEIFPTQVRATGCGACNAFGRIAGIFAPLLSSLFLGSSLELPIYAASLILFCTSVLIFFLPGARFGCTSPSIADDELVY